MSNNGKYFDRNPDVQAAGKVFKSVENIGDSLKNNSIDEAVLNIVNFKCKELHKDAQEGDTLSHAQYLPKEHLKDLLSPELRKSRFVAFKEKFSENMFFKKTEIGMATALASKPPEYTNENFIYGRRSKSADKLYELVFPNRTAKEIKKDFIKWHDKYLISHKRYLPSERIHREYNGNFKPHGTYGMSTNADKSGKRVKQFLQHCDRMVIINKVQKKFEDLRIGQLGKKIDRYNLNLSPNRTFGKPTTNKNNFNVKALIENVEACAEKEEITEALAHVNNLRRLLFNRSGFHMNDLAAILKISDENNNGYLKFSTIMRLLRSLQIRVDEEKIRAVLLHFQMFKDGNKIAELVSVKEFWKMLHIQYPLPREINSTEFTKTCPDHPTTYRSLCSDRDKKLIAVSQIIPCHLTERDLTTAGDLIAPDVSMRYGLSPKDFDVSRPKEEMCIIFKHLLSHNFDEIWQFACTKKGGESSGVMSVNEFKNYLDEYNRQLQ